ncbi:transposase [Xenorhabdus vietnamensis]|uniref:Transposase n=2 Tax=Xenorhabdus vietnamensis TaxID=351656 RepID=A0A1Y2S8G7_9GAMM|nr:transposase [Xenorhabdus vietnamensis]
MAMYADDIEAAYLAPSRLDALMNIDFLSGADQDEIAVIPVIKNLLFVLGQCRVNSGKLAKVVLPVI